MYYCNGWYGTVRFFPLPGRKACRAAGVTEAKRVCTFKCIPFLCKAYAQTSIIPAHGRLLYDRRPVLSIYCWPLCSSRYSVKERQNSFVVASLSKLKRITPLSQRIRIQEPTFASR